MLLFNRSYIVYWPYRTVKCVGLIKIGLIVLNFVDLCFRCSSSSSLVYVSIGLILVALDNSFITDAGILYFCFYNKLILRARIPLLVSDIAPCAIVILHF